MPVVFYGKGWVYDMPEVVGVRFKPCGKIYDFEVDGVDIQRGDKVVVESELGLYVGSIVKDRHIVESEERKLQKIILFFRNSN